MNDLDGNLSQALTSENETIKNDNSLLIRLMNEDINRVPTAEELINAATGQTFYDINDAASIELPSEKLRNFDEESIPDANIGAITLAIGRPADTNLYSLTDNMGDMLLLQAETPTFSPEIEWLACHIGNKLFDENLFAHEPKLGIHKGRKVVYRTPVTTATVNVIACRTFAARHLVSLPDKPLSDVVWDYLVDVFEDAGTLPQDIWNRIVDTYIIDALFACPRQLDLDWCCATRNKGLDTLNVSDIIGPAPTFGFGYSCVAHVDKHHYNRYIDNPDMLLQKSNRLARSYLSTEPENDTPDATFSEFMLSESGRDMRERIYQISNKLRYLDIGAACAKIPGIDNTTCAFLSAFLQIRFDSIVKPAYRMVKASLQIDDAPAESNETTKRPTPVVDNLKSENIDEDEQDLPEEDDDNTVYQNDYEEEPPEPDDIDPDDLPEQEPPDDDDPAM